MSCPICYQPRDTYCGSSVCPFPKPEEVVDLGPPGTRYPVMIREGHGIYRVNVDGTKTLIGKLCPN